MNERTAFNACASPMITHSQKPTERQIGRACGHVAFAITDFPVLPANAIGA
jgi:hypothetical protein